MEANSITIWRELFTKWPKELPRRGLVVSTLNESIAFKSFLLRGEVVLLERTNPDAMGARFVMLAFDAIHMVKLNEPFKESVLNAAGFVGQLAKA